ncbi:HlyD family type I secretion periplasmic adaptor subunit [Diaphorobacter sp. JS3050]|uniref:HlyD family type I secretion periplasmic adaptor subunit n=1 Tax=Diaphorobacter sp. JS3050 TaxID=2735554 RepID=UPI0015570CEF|nr:HlyD family type I secretion periplasmic adaptor subunit [Diaphorobacter sp. JS3050]QJY32261.1 HlyD family type I secretion periplasmic adaptor subunit [Diaphorobacter sp. JS3050]
MAQSLHFSDKKSQLTPDAQALDAADTVAKHDLGRAGRWGLWALGLGFGGFLLWAALAPLDEGVPGPGVVALDTKRKAVQHLSGGIVQQVLVREGDEVKEGQLLIKLDAAVARANYESVRQSYLGLLAMQARLQAEQLGKPGIAWPADLKEAASDPLIQQQILNQEQLFHTRRSLLRSDLQSIEENIQGQEGLLQSYAGMLGNRKNQLALLHEELGHLRDLVKEGYAPRNRQLELERSVADVNTSIADLQGNTLRARSAISDLRQRAISRQQEYRKEVETQLADVSRQVLVDGEKFRAVRNDLERTEIRSPADGQVVGLAVQTVGGVVQPGQKLMDIVPKGAPLLLEARVAPHMIDRVKAGMPVDVRFSSFANSPQLVVQGAVESVSGDLLTEPQSNVSYYLARVQVTGEGAKALGQRQLHPGMPVEVIFKGGERSMLTYLLHPLTKRLAASMTEE